MIYRGDNYHYCLECKCAINYGEIVTQGKWGYYCQQCSERENEPMSKCRDCGRTFLHGDVILYGALGCYCASRKNCFNKRKTMPNIKITAEIDGKIVPLNTISTESFEAIKALEKPKEIPVARIGAWNSDGRQRRLFLKITKSIMQGINDIGYSDDNMILVIDPGDGIVATQWSEKNDECQIKNYRNVRPL